MQSCSLTAAHEVSRVSGEVAEVEYHSPVSSALLGHAPRREQRVKKDDSMQDQWHAACFAVSSRVVRKVKQIRQGWFTMVPRLGATSVTRASRS